MTFLHHNPLTMFFKLKKIQEGQDILSKGWYRSKWDLKYMVNSIVKYLQIILKMQYQNSNLEDLEYLSKLLRNELMRGVYNEKLIIKTGGKG